MSGKIILNLAISLDGYIADEEGGYDWIAGHGDNHLDTEQEYPFSDFLKSIDIVVMGNKSYTQGFLDDKQYAGKKAYVATNGRHQDTDNVSFIGGDIVAPVIEERDAGKNIYLFGGGVAIDPFIKANVIDEYIIGIIPVILGKGRSLFLGNNPTIGLHLDKYSIREGISILYYSKI